MRQVKEALNTDVSRSQTGYVIARRLFAAGNAVRSQAESVNHVGAEKIGIAKSECLSQTRASGFQDFEVVLEHVVGRRIAGAIN